MAWQNKATGQIVDYGRIEVASPELGVEKALTVTLREFAEMLENGYPIAESEHRKQVEAVWVDAGYMAEVVYTFCLKQEGKIFYPSVGRGASQQRQQWYNRPTSTGSVVKKIGEGYHMNRLRSPRIDLLEVNADHWKTWVHQRLTTPVDETGSMMMFQGAPHEHLALAKHLTAERKTEEFISGKGVVTKWERVRKNNHWFDALYNACAAGHYVGVRLLDQPQPKQPQQWGKLSTLATNKHQQRSMKERWNDMRER